MAAVGTTQGSLVKWKYKLNQMFIQYKLKKKKIVFTITIQQQWTTSICTELITSSTIAKSTMGSEAVMLLNKYK